MSIGNTILKKSKILIVDDTLKYLQLLEEVLRADDIEIFVAHNGEQALKNCEKNNFDLILPDIQMPVMDGYETSSQLIANPKTSNIPIIFLTASYDNESTMRAFSAGAVDYITKPFNNLELKSRVKTQLELKRHRDSLEELVTKQTIELNEALSKLQADNKAKELFLANMSHEIRTPLNGVIGMATLLEMSELNGEQKEISKALSNSAQYLKSVIDDIFEYNMVNTGDIKVEEITFNLRETIAKCTEVCRFRCEEKGISFKVNYLQPLPANIITDQTKLTRIISILLSNSIKFTLSGKIELNVSYILGNEMLQIEISDTGIGIAQNHHEKIFEKFYQVNSSFQRPYTGLGIGLALCKELVNILGGKIQVQSNLHKGSSFTVSLKVKTAPEKIATIAQLTPVEGNQILLVEDNKTNQMVIKKLLSPYKLNIDVAENGKIALEMLEKKSYNLVFMDLMMPIMNGFDATKAIRAQEKWKNLPIVAQTASLLDNTRKKCIEAGMNDYLEKPVDLTKLVRIIDKFLKITKS